MKSTIGLFWIWALCAPLQDLSATPCEDPLRLFDKTRLASGFLDYQGPAFDTDSRFQFQGTYYYLLRHFAQHGFRVRRSHSSLILESDFVRAKIPNAIQSQIDVTLLADLKDIPDEVIGIVWPVAPRQKRKIESQFWIGRQNTRRAIELLKARNRRLNGMLFHDIELNMMPGEAVPRDVSDLRQAEIGNDVCRDTCNSGFIEPDESLSSVMIRQNDLVLKKLKTTHQALIRPLYKITWTLRNGFIQPGRPFLFNGVRFKAEAKSGGMGQLYSPFGDGTYSRTIVAVTNVGTGKIIYFSTLLVEMIFRYGFYESETIDHHLSPHDIVELMPFLQRQK